MTEKDEKYYESEEYAEKYRRAVLDKNVFNKSDVEYYQGKTKRKNPHGIPTSKWKKTLKDYKVVHHPNEYGNEWWTFEKKPFSVKASNRARQHKRRKPRKR